MTEPAPYDLGIVLHRSIAKHLVEKLNGDPAVELLTCARRFLEGQGLAGLAQDDKDRKALQRIRGLYVRALQAALESGTASASLLSEVGAFLHRSGALDGLQGRVETMRAVRELVDLDLPFSS